MYKGLFQDFFSFAATSSLAYSSPSTTGEIRWFQYILWLQQLEQYKDKY
jgi:hypothetical protein